MKNKIVFYTALLFVLEILLAGYKKMDYIRFDDLWYHGLFKMDNGQWCLKTIIPPKTSYSNPSVDSFVQAEYRENELHVFISLFWTRKSKISNKEIYSREIFTYIPLNLESKQNEFVRFFYKNDFEVLELSSTNSSDFRWASVGTILKDNIVLSEKYKKADLVCINKACEYIFPFDGVVKWIQKKGLSYILELDSMDSEKKVIFVGLSELYCEVGKKYEKGDIVGKDDSINKETLYRLVYYRNPHDFKQVQSNEIKFVYMKYDL